MRLRTFTAPTASRAIAEARRALGEDAVIVATQETDRGVRITAAVEDEGPDLAALLAPEAPSAVEAELAAACAHHELPAPLAAQLLGEARAAATAEPVSALSQALRALFRFAPLPEVAPIPLLLAGPPGAGKTASVAKLAARAKLAGRAVAVITTDVERAGGVAQLRALTEPLGLPLQVADDAAALRRAVAGSAALGDLVLVDTTGINPYSGADLARLSLLIEAARAEPLPVLAAGGGVADGAEVAATFRALGAKRFLLTKVDAARRLGGALAAAQAGLAFGEAGIGPLIGRGLGPLTPAGLARLLLRHRGEAAAGARRAATPGAEA
ncbi:MAG TPA: hypothetical protein VFG47_14860 [Geminicoccaceae bacterium]|nr:hypothetical protein [Geminicoccaceae bacterium]